MPAPAWARWVLRMLFSTTSAATAGRIRRMRDRDSGSAAAEPQVPPSRGAEPGAGATIATPEIATPEVGAPGAGAPEPTATGPPSLGIPGPTPGPRAGTLDVNVGADRATGLIPDHGARHLPRALWLAIYALALAGPFVLIAVRDRSAPRPFIFELGSAFGIAALSLLALQLMLPARLPLLSAIGAEVAVRLHRRLSDIMLAVVAAHVAAVMVADPSRLGLLRFFGEPWRAQAAIGSVAALAVLMITSLVRRRVRLSYARWRAVHLLLGALALVLAVVHTVGVGRYLMAGPAEWALVALTAAGLGALVALRSGRLRSRSVRPYTVERVITEKGGAITLGLRAEGHDGQRFIPGQFAWLKLPAVRASLAEHPFSYSSSAETPARPTFTIKTQAGFSAQAAGFEPGTTLLVDGPYGAFRPRATSSGTLLIAGGIGITPSMSILRTAADRGDRRPYLLLYGARSLDGVTFADELEALRERLNLTIVLVLSSPPPDWAGERGRINAGVLDRHLPPDVRGWQFMVCGSGPFVDGAVEALEAVGVPGERVHAERFVEV